MKHCEASNWNSAQVRRWLENEGFREFWHFLEPDAPISGHDILSLTGKNLCFSLTTDSSCQFLYGFECIFDMEFCLLKLLIFW